ncbi:MAG: 1,4-alpha-glucan branching protein domain-containing protein [bacterium]|nr:1,4-alpha-glucan branching protein domain-containing protein [bacterium]
MVTFVFHTHLPYVMHHGKWPHGSDWLCEAVAECYLPLLRMCDALLADGIRPGITFDISPVLCEQLTHPDFPDLFRAYCAEHAGLAAADRTQTEEPLPEELMHSASWWEAWYNDRAKEYDEVYNADIIGALRRLQDAGAIEVMTCAATHGYLPLLAEDASVDLQMFVARANYRRHFGRDPLGTWLPECAYRPAYAWHTMLPVAAYSRARKREGVEQVLARHDLHYFVTDEPPLMDAKRLNARNKKPLSPFELYVVGSPPHKERVGVLTRNIKISMQVWSAELGYPGDGDYLDFHKKSSRSGLRYWRVTDTKVDMSAKQMYVPENAQQRARDHAKHYVSILETAALHRISESDDAAVTICLPFDTELFGHWWFEGPTFIENVLRGIQTSAVLSRTLAHERMQPENVVGEIALPESSWGNNNNHSVWMQHETFWLWEREYALERRVRLLLEKHHRARWDETLARIMIALFRELLLAQASDWPFLISNGTARDYASMRFHSHAADCDRLCTTAERYATTKAMTDEDRAHLEAGEARGLIFAAELMEYIKR